MFEQVKNKNVLITGASGGIGFSIARLFYEYGANLGLHYNSNQRPLRDFTNDLSDYNDNVMLYKSNLLIINEINNLMESFIKNFKTIDILINNAGACFDYNHFLSINMDSWDKTYNLNVKAPYLLSKLAYKQMLKQKWGRIINISTNAIKYAGANTLHYTSSKAALDVVTSVFSKEGAKNNILVNSIRCGVIKTPMQKNVSGYTKDHFKKRVKMIPIGEEGTPLDIARVVLFLSSEGGNFITGEHLVVSGGE